MKQSNSGVGASRHDGVHSRRRLGAKSVAFAVASAAGIAGTLFQSHARMGIRHLSQRQRHNGQSSFNNGTNWSNSLAPTPAIR